MRTAHHENGEQVIENWNAVFKALSAEPRRQLIVSLLNASPDESVPLPESAIMPNVPPDPETLRMELHHTHLPLLTNRGFVTWDTDPLVAARGPRFDEVAVVFEALHSEATAIPDSLVVGCQRLEEEQQNNVDL
ncbi:hypothetical protein [Haloterrigena alkaliphila]|uniref:Transcriptional regulator n=1 Tax=Haloterrigena alkaliphila TaxID=2816475 RepID=A0A8A2VFM4_9EURY|nr:hypothetical protein [Haloterrigena alkaliphila]QSX00107.1 hypothetical protein J0X25_03830 [Haloterrigena alkaliphila]